MTLRVPFDDFPAAAARYDIKEVFLSAKNGYTEISGMMPGTDRILYSCSDADMETVKNLLTEAKLHAFEGAWFADTPEPEAKATPTEVYIAAVSYTSDESMPGIWVDAFPWLPTPVQVLRNLYDEFRDTGELAEVPFEEFVRLATPNVVIVSPHEVEGFLADKVES